MHEHTSLLDLFYALRGGGFGFGVIVSLTVRTHPLPDRLCVMDGSVVSYRKVSWSFIYIFHALNCSQLWQFCDLVILGS